MTLEVFSSRETDCAKATGAWFTACTVMVKLSAGEVSLPPRSVPPSSLSRTLTVARPLALVTVVKVSAPSGLIAGCAENKLGRSLLTRNSTVCAASLAGPELMFVAQLGTVKGPLSSTTTWSAPGVNEGASVTGLTVMGQVGGA